MFKKAFLVVAVLFCTNSYADFYVCKDAKKHKLYTNTPCDGSNDSSASKTQTYQCDGRTYCSQMTSCAEARFFRKNCSDTKMDGDMDGIPCEDQWCGH